MPVARGLVPPAIITSTIVLVLCSIGWGAFGALSFAAPTALSTTGHRYLSILLATMTICAVIVNMTARIVAVIRAEAPTVCGYAEGYTDALDAHPGASVSGVSRLVPTRR